MALILIADLDMDVDMDVEKFELPILPKDMSHVVIRLSAVESQVPPTCFWE